MSYPFDTLPIVDVDRKAFVKDLPTLNLGAWRLICKATTALKLSTLDITIDQAIDRACNGTGSYLPEDQVVAVAEKILCNSTYDLGQKFFRRMIQIESLAFESTRKGQGLVEFALVLGLVLLLVWVVTKGFGVDIFPMLNTAIASVPAPTPEAWDIVCKVSSLFCK